MAVPKGLGAGGRKLWRDITSAHELDVVQVVQLLECCRTKDQLDRLDEILRGEADAWCRITTTLNDAGEVKVVVNAAIDKRLSAATLFKSQLAALRLPDAVTGKKPQRRGTRGSYQPRTAPEGNVTAIDRARKRRQA